MTVDVTKAAELLKGSDDILILSHRSPDGDTLGGGFALYYALKKLGKRVRLECADEVPKKFRFLTDGIVKEEFEPQFTVAVDVADLKLLGDSLAKKYGGKIDLSIDHHLSHRDFSTFSLVEDRAAACEIIYRIIEKLGVAVDSRIADCLYIGIATDTGCFRYSNTSPNTHICAAELIKLGADNAGINKRIFETKTKSYAALERLVMNSLEMHLDGRVALVTVTQDMFRESGSDEAECDGISALPRQIEGVLAGVTIRETSDGSYKISVRTNEPVDACEICSALGGGGHVRASGCTVTGTLDEAKKKILDVIKEKI
jgi:phosphoesterase RecJ-like protein